MLVATTQPGSRSSAFWDSVRRWGYVRAVYALAMSRLQRHLHLNFCRVTTRPLGNVHTSAAPPNRTYKALSEQELIRFGSDAELEMTPELIRAALKRGDVCVGAIENNALIGYTWFAFATAPHLDGLWVTFVPEARYAYKTFVRPEFRGGRVASDLNAHGDGICLERGKTIGIGFIDTHNFASYRTSKRVGARTIGYAGYLQCFGKTLAFRSRGAKRYGFRFYRPPSSGA